MKTQTLSVLATAFGCALSITVLAADVQALDSPVELQKGIPVMIAGASGDEYRNLYALYEDAKQLTISISGGVGDPDLYVRLDAQPLKHTYDCRPYVSGNNETCTFNDVSPGDYHVMVHGYSSFSGLTLVADHVPQDAGPDLIDVAQDEFVFREVEVPAGATELVVSITGGTGDADLYLKFGSQPTRYSYDCRPYISGSNEQCNVKAPQAGTYHVGVYGYTASQGVSYSAQVHL